MFNISFNYYHLTQEAGYLNDNYIINRNVLKLSGNLTCKLGYDITSSMYISYSPKTQDSRFTTYSTTYFGIYFNKNFMNNKFQVSLSVNDILRASHYKSETITPDFYSYSNSRQLFTPSVGFSFRYSFNDFKMKNERKVDDDRDKAEGGIF
jgi:hypothetical protein